MINRSTGEMVASWDAPGERGLLPSWSPDGRYVTFGGFVGRSVGIWCLDIDSGEATQLAEGLFTLPIWSPDGSRLSFDFRQRRTREVWVVGLKWIEARLEDQTPVFSRP